MSIPAQSLPDLRHCPSSSHEAAAAHRHIPTWAAPSSLPVHPPPASPRVLGLCGQVLQGAAKVASARHQELLLCWRQPVPASCRHPGKGGGGRDVPGAIAGIPLQPMEKTMVTQAVSLQPVKDHTTADIHPAAHGGLHTRAACSLWAVSHRKDPRWSFLICFSSPVLLRKGSEGAAHGNQPRISHHNLLLLTEVLNHTARTPVKFLPPSIYSTPRAARQRRYP